MSNLNHKKPITSPRTHFFVPFHLYKTTSPGSAFSTITFSRLRLLIYLYDVLLDTRYQQQPPRSQTGGYTCDCRRRGSASYAAQPASHQYGQLWHDKRSPASQREQSYPYSMCSVSLIIWTQQYAMPVVQHAYHNVGHVQGVPERQRVIYPVRTNLSSPHVFSTRPFAVGESRTKWRVLLCSSACYTRPHPGPSSLSTGPPSSHSWPAGIRESPTTRQPLCTTPGFTG
jgi:hypothetical protein